MKFPATIATVLLIAGAATMSADVPKAFEGIFEQDVPVRGQIGMVLPPAEIDKYVAKVETAARKDPKWFREFTASSKPGVPLPYDERLGLSQEEYAEYLALWDKREFKPVEDVMILLRRSGDDSWALTCTGAASSVSTLRYSPAADVFRSPNGELKRIDDIKADSSSILGEWVGREWKFEEATPLGKTKENIAVGTFADKKHGLVVYRFLELSTEGTRLLDKSLVIRFALGKAGHMKEPAKPAPKTSSAPRR